MHAEFNRCQIGALACSGPWRASTAWPTLPNRSGSQEALNAAVLSHTVLPAAYPPARPTVDEDTGPIGPDPRSNRRAGGYGRQDRVGQHRGVSASWEPDLFGRWAMPWRRQGRERRAPPIYIG